MNEMVIFKEKEYVERDMIDLNKCFTTTEVRVRKEDGGLAMMSHLKFVFKKVITFRAVMISHFHYYHGQNNSRNVLNFPLVLYCDIPKLHVIRWFVYIKSVGMFLTCWCLRENSFWKCWEGVFRRLFAYILGGLLPDRCESQCIWLISCQTCFSCIERSLFSTA